MAAHPDRPQPVYAAVRQIPTLRHVADGPAPPAPGVPPLLQGRVVQLTGEAQLGLESEPLPGSGIETIAVGALQSPGLAVHEHHRVAHLRQLYVNRACPVT